jgi:hypothetical protein
MVAGARPVGFRKGVMAKEANASLEALDAELLAQELPGIGIAFDRAAMLDHFQAALIGPPNSNRFRRCGLTSAVLLNDSVVLRYTMEVVDPEGKSRSAIITGRVFGTSGRAASYAEERLAPLARQMVGREETAALTSPVAVLEQLGMAAYAFPIDGELPTLVAATDSSVAGPALGELLFVNGRSDVVIENCRAEPIHYNRRHRCMMRYELDLSGGEHMALYGKVAADASGARIPDLVAALTEPLAGAGVTIPECLGWRQDLQLVTFTEIPGVPRVAQLLKARLRGDDAVEEPSLEDAVETCGRIAATLHTSGLRLGEPRTLESEVVRLRENLSPIQRLSADLGRQLEEWLDLVEQRAAASPALDLCQCHGDFSYTQLIFDGSRPGLVDFDNFCQAEPALDLGQFLAYLRYAGIKARGNSRAERAGLSRDLAGRFADAYVTAGGPAAALERVDLYEAINLTRMAEHAWQNLKSRRLEGIVMLLGERMAA